VSTPARFRFVGPGLVPQPQELAPLLPARLSRNGVDVAVSALVDSGATISVVPFDVGARSGYSWNAVALGGVAGGAVGKLIAVDLMFNPFGRIPQMFAGSSSNDQPVIFGRAMFFFDFDVCFHRARGYFEIQPATAATP
jgi:hypothetical protein